MNILLLRAGFDDRQAEITDLLLQGLKSEEKIQHVFSVDVLDRFVRPVARTVLREMHGVLLDWMPRFWEYLYKNSTSVGGWTSLDRLRVAFDVKRFQAYTKKNQIDIIMTLHPLACLPASLSKREKALEIPVLALVPHFHLHPSWLQPGISSYAFLSEKIEESFHSYGLHKHKAFVSGAPLAQDFLELPSIQEVEERFGLSEDSKPRLLILSKGMLFDEIEELFLSFVRLYLRGFDGTLFFDVGDDQEMAEYVREAAERYRLPAKMFGAQPSLRDFFLIADLVISRYETSRALEAMACSTPLLFLEPDAGTDQKDVKALVDLGLASVCKERDSIVEGIEASLKDEQLVREEATSFEGFSSNGVENIVKQVLYLSENREEILQRDQSLLRDEHRLLAEYYQKRGLEDGHPEDPTKQLVVEETPQSPFEDIGLLGGESKKKGGSKVASERRSTPRASRLSLDEERQLKKRFRAMKVEDELQALKQKLQLPKGKLSDLKDEEW